jgi:hypothetical protein
VPTGRLYRRLVAEVAAADLPAGPEGSPVVTGADLAGLPAAAQRYLRFMGVLGRPRDWSLRARFVGRFRMRPDTGWMPAVAWQYNSAVDIARVFCLRLRLAGVLPMVGSDIYVRGHGRMLGKLLGVYTVADGQGPEFDHSELVTWLNDAVLLAPSMLLRPAVMWDHVDSDSFDVTLIDEPNAVTARVFVDARGAPVNFATDRYAALPGGTVLARWRTPVQSWDTAGGRPLPGPARAIYTLPDGPFCYVEGRFEPGSLAYNIPPR